MKGKRLPCGLRETDRLDYADGAVNGARGEYVDAHVRHCPACQAWLADFEALGRLLHEGLEAPDEPWHRAAFTERLIEELRKEARPRRSRLFLGALGGIALVLLLALLPLSTQGGQFLNGVVEFGKVEVKRYLPLDQQRNLLDTLDFTQHEGATPQITPVAPLDLPEGLTLTKHKIADDGHIELLYEDGDRTTIWVEEYAPRPGLLRTEMSSNKQILVVDGVQVLIFDDPRPNAVAAFTWTHDRVFFNVLVLAAPPGTNGGLKLQSTLDIVRALNASR